MEIIKIEKSQLIRFLYDSSIRVGEGSNGIVSIYNKNTLAKIHFKEIEKSYYSEDFSFLSEEIAKKLSFDKKLEPLGLDKLSILKKLIIHLNNSYSPLIKGIIMYEDYPIGILMEYYFGYKTLEKIIFQLDTPSRIKVYERIKFLLYDLIKNEVYPRDIKFGNIMVNKDTLDVKIIDLDDQETIVGNRAHAKENSMKYIEKFLDTLTDYLKANTQRKEKVLKKNNETIFQSFSKKNED